eukprot:s4440_g1.t4
MQECGPRTRTQRLSAFSSLLQRRARSLVAADDGFACALFEAYKALEQKGVVLVWQPTDVDLAIASVWPDCAAPERLVPLSTKLADRCLRLADPDLGLGRLLGILPDGRPSTALATWPADVVLPGAEHGEFTVAGRRIWSETVEGEFASALAMTKHVLRLLFFASGCRGQGPGPFRYSLLQFPRNLAPEDTPWVTIAVRDAVPWRSLDRHPEVYQTTPRLRPVKLCITELKALRLEGEIVAEDAAGGKVSKGWRLSPGGDLPAVAPTAVLAAELLGVKSDAVPSPKASEKPSQRLAELVSSCKEDSATLIFDTAPNELKATVPATRALPVDLCFQARGAEEFLTKTFEVPRRGHMQTEAMLLGASLARLAIQNEVAPLEWTTAAAALQRAEQALHGCTRCLQQLYCREMPDWLLKETAPSRSKPRCRTLCNEAVGDVVEAWRLLSSESNVTDLGEYFTNQFLSLSCYGSLIATQPASYLGAEGPLLASEVLVNYTGAQPELHMWGALPVLSKPGRFAAQLWMMLRLDKSLRSYGEEFNAVISRRSHSDNLCSGRTHRRNAMAWNATTAPKSSSLWEASPALTDGFLQCYLKEASSGSSVAAVRLRLHCVLVILELMELRREIHRLGVKDPYPQLPSEAALRETLRQELLQAVAAFRSHASPPQQGKAVEAMQP